LGHIFCISKEFDDEDFIDIVVMKAKYGKLAEYIGDMIIGGYKKMIQKSNPFGILMLIEKLML